MKKSDDELAKRCAEHMLENDLASQAMGMKVESFRQGFVHDVYWGRARTCDDR